MVEQIREIGKRKTNVQDLVSIVVGNIIVFPEAIMLGVLIEYNSEATGTSTDILLRSTMGTLGYNMIWGIGSEFVNALTGKDISSGWDSLYISPGIAAGLYTGMILARSVRG